jgi:Spy/CpxP family protein refolding chaperone
MTGRSSLISVATTAATAMTFACAIAAEPESPGGYSSDLSRVYWGYYQVLAQKEACDAALPATRAANDKAFTAWQAQHKALVEELRRRVTAMIRLASTDEKDYARNLGKYEGAILQERHDYRESLLKLGTEELRGQCQRMAEVLKSPDANLAQVYAVELEAIRKRK